MSPTGEQSKTPEHPDDLLSATFAALAHPVRRAILARLREGEATVAELAEPFDISAPAITKHLKVLQRAGLVSQGRQKQWRPCRLDADPLREVETWLEPYRRLWEERFDRLEIYLRELQAQDTPSSAGQPGDPHTPAASSYVSKPVDTGDEE